MLWLVEWLIVSEDIHKIEDSVKEVAVWVVNFSSENSINEAFKVELIVDFCQSINPERLCSLAFSVIVMSVNLLSVLKQSLQLN